MKRPYKIAYDYIDLDDLLNQFSVPLRNHSRRVAMCSAIIAEHADEYLRFYGLRGEEEFVLAVHLGGTCHDIGKLLIPTLITDEEDYLTHPARGMELLERNVEALFDNERQTKIVLDMVRHHHERADGSGFPDGLKGKEILPAASICAIADWLDQQLCLGNAGFQDTAGIEKEIKEQTGALFSENAVSCFESAWPRLREQYDKWGRCVG